MSVLERYKNRSTYQKSEDMPLSPIETNIYQPFPIEPSSLLDRSGQADEAMSVPQLSFTDNPISSVSGEELTAPVAPEGSTALIASDVPMDQAALPAQTNAKSLREPTRIRSTGKKSPGTMLAPKVSGKRTLTHAVMVALTFLVVLGVLAAVVPLGDSHAQGGFGGFIKSFVNWNQSKSSNTALSASQIATATAVMQDGYDAGGNATYAGIPGPPVSGSPNLNRFFYPQCTYYANMEYGLLTGHYVSWLGNANQWAGGARASGWVVSSTPTVPSIVAFDSYVGGAGAYGHVGVVTSVSGNSFTYGSWNVAGAPPATTVYLTNSWPAAGIWFITYPG